MKFLNLQAKNVFLFILFLAPSIAFSQVNSNGTNATAIPTAVPFLLISPDSRSGALGEAGVALSPDANANFWNPAKLAFIEGGDDISTSYSPWLRSLVPDVSLSYLSFAHRLDDRNTLGASIRYFNLGTITGTDGAQNFLGNYTPNEFSIDGSFARTFGNNFSLGLSLRYIHSALVSGLAAPQAKAGNAVAADISMFHKSSIQEFGGKDALFSYGFDISNIGSKISYSNDGSKYFLPANLRIGFANTINLDNANQVTFALDFNKLLVPTNQSDNVSVPAGIFGSFSDTGFGEELQEITISPGVEYWYNKLFALRVGYFYEDANKGGLHYLTLGTGFKYDVFAFNFSYIAASQQNSPLANTLRFSLMANFGGTK